jgi:hypothetical protein
MILFLHALLQGELYLGLKKKYGVDVACAKEKKKRRKKKRRYGILYISRLH